MKRFTKLFVLAAALAAALTIAAGAAWQDRFTAYAVEGGNIYFYPESGEIVGSDSTVTKVVIPDKIDGVAVTGIGQDAFAYCELLTYIHLPDALETIEADAFWECESLSTFSISASAANFSVDSNGILFDKNKSELICFPPASSLTDYEVPLGVIRIGENAFGGCRQLYRITLPSTITSIGSHAFYFCFELRSISVPEGVTTIASGAFYGCIALTNISLPSSLVSIKDNAFNGCRQLSAIVLPSSLKEIGYHAFSSCDMLSEVILPNGLEKIGSYAFSENENLTMVLIPASTTSIGSDLFHHSPNAVIYGEAGSAAEAYAEEYRHTFYPIGSGTISGRVITTDGSGIDGVSIMLTDAESGIVQTKTTSRSDGSWYTPFVHEGHAYRVSYYHSDYQTNGQEYTYAIDAKPVKARTRLMAKTVWDTSGTASTAKLTRSALAAAMTQPVIDDPYSLYIETPSVTQPYSSGAVREDILLGGLARLNSARWIAGLPHHVTLDDTYIQYCQDGSLVNAANNVMSHTPSQPAGMSYALYRSGYTGTSSSNLTTHYACPAEGGTLAYAVDLYMDDSDSSNVDCVGHRRWILSPTMGKTGMGCANNGRKIFSALYAFDRTGPAQAYDFISWPASGSFPREYFKSNEAWSVSLDPGCYASPVKANITVTLTALESGKTWIFFGDQQYSAASSGLYFNVDCGGYGVSNCIIFRPDDIDAYEGVYTVTIEGLTDLTGNPASLSYYVNFVTTEGYDTNVASSLCGYGLEWERGSDEQLKLMGVNEMDAAIALAAYRNGRMTDIVYLNPGELEVIDRSLACPDGTEVKLFRLGEDMSQAAECWSMQF